jgi:myo-inositol 2-dehydrogenase / D-chiro-inositol 1-dehydrogenase
MRKLGVGMIGVGAIGRLHAENLALNIPKAFLAGIADANLSVAKEVAAKLGVEKVYSDYKQMLEDKDVEAVAIATPTFLKREMIATIARKGKHIFVEKPMALTVADCDEMISEAKKGGVKLQVGYQRRFDHAFVKADKAVTSGEIGKLQLIKSCTRDPPAEIQGWAVDPKLSGGIWLDTCSHDFDAIRFLSKAEVTQVFAEAVNSVYEKLKPLGGIDNVFIVMVLSNGALAEVDSCQYTVYGYDVRAEVIGTKSAAFIGMGENSSTTILKNNAATLETPFTFQERFGQAYRDELVDFVNRILANEELKVRGEDGKKAVEIGLAAAESARKHVPIQLPMK